MRDELRYAVLIDAENVSPKYVKIILDEVSNYGTITVRRIYGDWTTTRNNGWKETLLDFSISPIQQYSYTEGKNASDSAMIIDAMDILYTKRVEGFCLVSSDSDFTRLAARLRESGMNVIGMGESKTPTAFIAACNTFKYLDILFRDLESDDSTETTAEEADPPTKNTHRSRHPKVARENVAMADTKVAKNARALGSDDREKEKKDAPQPQTKLSTVRRALRTIVWENSDDDDWISSASLGNLLVKRFPDFDVRNYGYKKLTEFLESLGDFEVDRSSAVPGGKVQNILIRLKK